MFADSTAPRRNWIRVHIWEHLLVALIIVCSILYALPSFFPSQPSVQISANTANARVDDALARRVERLLDSQQIALLDAEVVNLASGRDRVELVFEDAASQLRARSIIGEALGRGYVTALNTKPTIPSWLTSLGGRSISLGLDLQGGVHFLLEVDTQEALHQRLEALQSEVRDVLRGSRVPFISFDRHASLPDEEFINALSVAFAAAEDRDRARSILAERFGLLYQLDNAGESASPELEIALSANSIRDIQTAAIEQNLISLRNRVNELGVAEPLVQRQGRNRIVVELPGVQDTTQAKRIIGATANLEFRLEAEQQAQADSIVSFAFRDQPGQRASLEREVIVTGANVIDAQAGFDENGRPQVNIELDGPGGNNMGEVTRNAIGRSMGAVFIEYKTRQEADASGQISNSRFIEKSIISLATIQGAFSNRFRITGLRDQFESVELALLLRAGSLAAPVYFVEERTIGASLGEENIRLGTISMLIGLALVTMFMLFFYRGCGALAIAALLVNTGLIIAALALLSATLTLPGIAGLVLTLGMVVDANILIFARVRSELKRGASPPIALENGFSRAFVTIVDANFTTLLVAIILFAIGTGPVRGFAITLSLGIVGSLISCTFMVRYALKILLGRSARLSPYLLPV